MSPFPAVEQLQDQEEIRHAGLRQESQRDRSPRTGKASACGTTLLETRCQHGVGTGPLVRQISHTVLMFKCPSQGALLLLCIRDES